MFVLGLEDRASGSPEGLQFDPELNRASLSKALANSRHLLEVPDRRPDAYRAELVIELASERESDRDGEIGVYRAVQVELAIHRNFDGVRDRVTAQGKAFEVQEPGRADRQDGFDRVLKRAVQRAVELIDLQLDVRSLTAQAVIERLEDKASEERLYVLRSLRDRKEPEFVPAVIRLLSDPDDEIVLEAVGVLVAQQDRRAVEPLIRMSQTRDPVFQLQIVTAVAELGGEVARGYLFTLAAGHGAAEIRKRAQEGLERILQTAPALKSSDTDGQALALPRPVAPDAGPVQ